MGYLFTMARANYCPHYRWTVELVGYREAQCLFPSDTAIDALAAATGQARFCPGFLKGQEPWSLLWRLAPVTTCLTHGRLLVEVCPRCGQQVRVHNLWANACQCGQVLSEIEAPHVDRGTDAHRAQEQIQHLLLATLVDKSIPEMDGMTGQTWMASLDVMTRWLWDFPDGIFEVDGMSLPPKPKKRHLTSAPVLVDHLHYAIAARVLRDGQPAFDEISDRWLSTRTLTNDR